MLELGKWNKAEHEVKTDLDKLILLMKFTDTPTAQDPIPEVLTRQEWTRRILEQLRTDDLTSEERVAYQMELAKQASYDEMDRTFEQGMKKVEEAEQKVEEAEQKAEEAKQVNIKKLLQKGVLTDEDIAEIFDVDITDIQSIKDSLES